MFTVNEILSATGGRLLRGSALASCAGISIDSRAIKPGEVFIAIKGNNFDGHDFIEEAVKNGASCLVVKAQSVPRILSKIEGELVSSGRKAQGVAVIEVRDTTKALGDIALFNRNKFNIPVIAVTGSNGKTTTKEMVSWVLSKKFKVLKNPGTKNNHIGLPFTLCGLDSSIELAVLEVGTNHPGEVEYLSRIAGPNICVITNIGPAHLEFFKNLDGVLKEKTSLLNFSRAPLLSILNTDDPLLKKFAAKNDSMGIIMGVSLKERKEFFASKIKISTEGLTFSLNEKEEVSLKTLGYLNVYNALIAIACGRIFGLSCKEISERLEDFEFMQDRLRIIRVNDVSFINDTYNSNPVSLKQSLDVLGSYPAKGRKICVMGDMMELGLQKKFFHCQAGEKAADVCHALICVGKLSLLTADAARSSGLDSRHIYTCDNSIQAREILFKKILPGRDDIVLVKGSRAMKMEEVFGA